MAEKINLIEEKIKDKKEFLTRYFLLRYLYTGDKETLKDAETSDKEMWEKWRCAVLLETNLGFFDSAGDQVSLELERELRRKFYYLNLNPRQSLLLFYDANSDYQLIAKQIRIILRRRYVQRFYLSISRRFQGWEPLPDILDQLEQRMEERFYYKENRVFFSEEEELNSVGKEVQDAHLVQLISEDISREDTEQLRKHFGYLKEKYSKGSGFSAMYVKFVFSNVVQEIFNESQFADETRLEKEIDYLYSCNSLRQILAVTERLIEEYEDFLECSGSESRKEVEKAKKYIEDNYKKDVTPQLLAEEVSLPCGYLSFIFKRELGMSIHRYLHMQRMLQARELLRDTSADLENVSREVGFANPEYFYKSYWEYFGCEPKTAAFA